MIYDIIITFDTESQNKDERYRVISLRIEAESPGAAKIEATKKINEMGFDQFNRSAFSMREAR